MATTDSDIITSFHSTFQDTVILPEALEKQWVIDAVSLYELDIDPLEYDKDAGTFGADLPQYVIKILGMYMKEFYLERELSRIMKLNNIITKDITMNGNGDNKKVAIENLKNHKSVIAEFINKLKPSAYA